MKTDETLKSDITIIIHNYHARQYDTFKHIPSKMTYHHLIILNYSPKNNRFFDLTAVISCALPIMLCYFEINKNIGMFWSKHTLIDVFMKYITVNLMIQKYNFQEFTKYICCELAII